MVRTIWMEDKMAKKFKQHLYVGEIIKNTDQEQYWEVVSAISHKEKYKNTDRKDNIRWPLWHYEIKRLSDGQIFRTSRGAKNIGPWFEIVQMSEERIWNL